MKEIEDIIKAFDQAQQQGKQTALATVVKVEGSSYRRAGARMLGPNSAGVFAAGSALNCLGWKVPHGKIAVITQSGNMAVTFTHYARAKFVGFASVIAFGNSADLKLSELVDLLQNDEQTSSILIYCEGFSDGDGRRGTARATAPAAQRAVSAPRPAWRYSYNRGR